MLLVLASGRFLSSTAYSEDPVLLLLGTGLLLLSAAMTQLVQKKIDGPEGRMILYWICTGLVAGVQLTGGSSSIFYTVYLLFLMWVSLPSIAASATELGLIIGFIEAFSLLNAFIWTGGHSLISRLIPLLLPALKALLVPFIFGLTSDWLTEKEFFPADSVKPKEKDRHPGRQSIDASRQLLQIIHRNAGADSTCLFVRSEDGFYRLTEFAGGEGTVISKFMLPPTHRLARISENSSETVSIRADSKEERSELSPYRFPGTDDGNSLWIFLCPIRGETISEGFLLQDFSGDKPSVEVISDLENLSEILQGTCRKESKHLMSEFSIISKLVSACNESNLDKAVAGMAAILSELMDNATISIADVDLSHGKTSVWVARGPHARWRRGRVFDSSAGVAGWIINNSVPCRRSGMKHGGKTVHAYAAVGSDLHARAGSCMGAPVIRDGTVLALIMAEHEDDNVFMQHHEEILMAAAGMFSMREELAGLRERFRNISGRDTLTGLPCITLLDRHLHHMAKEVQTFGWYVGVIVADIDDFDEHNRKLGYAEGDRLLVDTADRFCSCFADDVFVARIGPDSLAACIPRAGKAVMEAISQRVADTLSYRYAAGKSETAVPVSASIGSAYTHVNRKVLLLTGEAVKAVTDASSTGPGTCVVRKIGISGLEQS